MILTHSPSTDSNYYYYTCLTLIDITKTDAVRSYNKGMGDTEEEYAIKRNQRRNWESIVQVISLRCQPFDITGPIIYVDEDLKDIGFGSKFNRGKVWSFTFGIEVDDIFDLPGRQNGALLDDIHNVPIITQLTESVNIDIELFDTMTDKLKNIIIIK